MSEEAAKPLSHAIVRSVAIVGLIAYAAAVLLSGTDRLSRKSPDSPALVGWFYDTGGAQSRAIAAFVKYGPLSAEPYARRGILSDPISAQAVSLLGRSQLYAGQPAAARATFEVSGRLGWRDAMTQLYWLDQAVQAGEMRVASERLDAILRQDPHFANRDRLLSIVSASPEGRAALATRLSLVPSWADDYVTEVKDLPANELSERANIMQLVKPGVWDCGAIAPMAQRMIDAGMLDAAQAVWRKNCSASDSLVYDGGFERLDTTKPSSGFGWRLTNRGDVDLQLAQDSTGKHRLELDSGAPQSVPVFRQLVVLKPGRYRLTWRTPETDQKAAAGLAVSLSCEPNLRDAVQGTPDPSVKDGHLQDFTVDSVCPVSQLVFWLAPRSQVRIDDIALR